ncbi:MAG: thermonuclease family protein [Lachnospiraceae bacterium]|nr:thermonuclease family protein [Lachnospiraceae bacterium]
MKSELQELTEVKNTMNRAKRQGKSYQRKRRNIGSHKPRILILLILAVMILFAAGRIGFKTVKESGELEAVRLVRVVDGDTIIVEKAGEEIRVRLLCVNCEESVHWYAERNTEKGKEAGEFAKEYLEDYPTLYLQYDEELYDQYDRVLAYVWLTDDVDVESKEDVEQYMFNAILLEEGQAEVVVYEPNHRYADWFYEIQENAN